MIRSITLLSIKFYQKFISPYKGFSCADNVLHKNGSCSKKVADIIRNKPIKDWRVSIKDQFISCRKSLATINHQNDKKRKKDGECCIDYFDSCDVVDACS